MNKFNSLDIKYPCLTDEILINKILTMCDKKVFKAGEKITFPGNILEAIKYIGKGNVRAYLIDAKGNEKILYDLCEGWFLRENLFIESEYTTVAKNLTVATTDTEIYYITKPIFEHLVSSTNLSTELLKSACLKKSIIINYLSGVCFDDVQTRIIHTLASYVDTNSISANGQWYDIEANYTHLHLSKLLGANRVTVSKAINKLRNDGIIRTVNGKTQLSIDSYNKIIND